MRIAKTKFRKKIKSPYNIPIQLIAGKTVGRIPDNLAQIFQNKQASGDITQVTYHSTEKPTISKTSHVFSVFLEVLKRKGLTWW